MTEKKCRKCGEIKPVIFFGKESRSKNGYKSRCKKCCNEYHNSIYHIFKEKKLAHAKIYYSENIDHLIELRKNHKKPDINHVRKIKAAYREKNKIAIRKYMRDYHKARRANDPLFRMSARIRNIVNKLMKNRNGNIQSMLGYTIEELVNKIGLIENTEKHIDHKVPVSWFIVGTDIRIINDLDNLQLLSLTDNVRKHNCFADPVPLKYYLSIKDHIKPQYLNLLKT